LNHQADKRSKRTSKRS